MPKLTFDCDCGADVHVWQDDAPAPIIKGKHDVFCRLCKKFVAHVTDGRKILRVTA
jgi:hypothetical protein